ncbi:MAG: rhodanese-related sulfurtransferase, partial [Pseudomonadota bacterium]
VISRLLIINYLTVWFMNFVIATFYHFFDFHSFEQMQDELKSRMGDLGIKGMLLITSEGINSTISGKRAAIDEFLSYLKNDLAKGEFEHKESLCDVQPFKRARVKIKKETISIGEDLSLAKRGKYLNSSEWNNLLDDKDTIIIDTRNNYEVHLGTFEGAINPNIRNFKQLPAFMRENLADAKHKKIATFCTGGIRCEKFTSWLLKEGFNDVYHLKGGILKYFEEMPQENSKWNGECYVFDERIAVDHNLAPSKTVSLCMKCDHTLTFEEQLHKDYEKGVSCQYCKSQS